MATNNTQTTNDLPLLANTNEIQVRHFVMDMQCDLDNRVFDGCLYLFITRSGFCFNIQDYQSYSSCLNQTTDKFTMILDSCDLYFISVSEVLVDNTTVENLIQMSLNQEEDILRLLKNSREKDLNFEVTKWSLNLRKQLVNDDEMPKVIKIQYTTLPHGRSLLWVLDQAGRPCVYSAGMLVNNRALVPCQEFGSLSTWRAHITVPSQASVLMTADTILPVIEMENGQQTFGFINTAPLPSFTLALAVGYWSVFTPPPDATLLPTPKSTCNHSPACAIPFPSNKVSWRLWAADDNLLERACAEFGEYLPRGLAACQQLLGPSPFPRLDVLIYPASSHDMAFTSPNLIFLSQSLLPGDGSMLVKVAHELSHYWWGLLIGARDWTEEWLSEGFSTFTEDLIHAKAMQWSASELRERLQIRAALRFNVLKAELEKTPPTLHILRPNGGKEADVVTCVKNGMNPRKQYMQLHYLKGYFLLRYLSEKVGTWRFAEVLHKYITQYHGCMVRSQDFIHLVFTEYPEITQDGITEDSVCTEWLDGSELPQYLKSWTISPDNSLHNTTLQELEKWRELIQATQRTRRGATKLRKLQPPQLDFVPLSADQLVLLLEELLLERSIASVALCRLRREYNMESANADIRHRWCELVVKHYLASYYSDVSHFLVHDQAMGVYLYAELIISRCPRQRRLAEKCFALVCKHMEAGTRNSVHLMVYGTDYQEKESI